MLTFEAMKIPGAYRIRPFYAEDNRGCFFKPFLKEEFEAQGISFDCSETFFSHSVRNVIRGMHFQMYHPQDKLVQVLAGKVFDVIVDLREDSPYYGQWEGEYLSAENCLGLFIPKGCAHGFLALEDDNLMCYQCCGKYDKHTDTGIMYNDPEIGVEWPIDDLKKAIVGARDQQQMSFNTFRTQYGFEF